MHSTPYDQAVTDSPTARYTSAPIRGIAVASISLGFFSSIVFWWYPLGLILASAGFVCGVGSLLFGIRGGGRGENLALIGTALCATSLTVIITLCFVLGFIQWNH